ncbi:GAK7 protein, partial [Amazona guildingii]|nr:GAK7 protein [Amazona guildingii]
MDRQVAYDLFISFLEKRNLRDLNLKKEVPELLAYGYAKGIFVNPHTVHDLKEWRKLRDVLWEAVLEDDKIAKKLGKVWRTVHNALMQHTAERKAAEKAVEAHRRNRDYGQTGPAEGEPLAPAVTSIRIPRVREMQEEEEVEPTAPPIEEKEGGGSPGIVEEAAGTSHDWPPPRLPASQYKECPRPPPNMSNPIPGAPSNLWEEMAKQRREAWAALAREAAQRGDDDVLEAASHLACPVTYTPVYDQQGQHVADQGAYSILDWKLLSQLRATVSQFGIKSEPTRQMLDYIFNTMLLLPSDLRGIVRLIFTPRQQLLFNAHWQALVNESVAANRAPGDPLQGVTVDELMGLGPFLRTEAQILIGADKVREAMRLVRAAIDRVKEPGGMPAYMGIKQGREESFGNFIDKAAAAIDRAGVPEYMKGALLKQCALQNSTPATQRVLSTLGANWSIEEALERMAMQPTGAQALLVEAIKELGLGIQKQAESTQNQVLAALAPLRTSATVAAGGQRTPQICYRCGQGGHVRRDCQARGVWCQSCQSSTHNTTACRRRSGNGKRSAQGSRAPTQIAAVTSAPPPVFNQQQQAASGSTWQHQ